MQRQISFLKEKYRITTAGFTDSGLPDVSFIQLVPIRGSLLKKGLQALRLKVGRFESYYWNVSSVREAYKCLAGKSWRLILANDLNSLPLGLELARPYGAKVLLDAHEYEPCHFDDKWQFNFFFKDFWEYIARKYLPQADAMTTVCESIAKKYSQTFGVSCNVITNAAYYQQLEPTETLPDQIRLIHHGICNPSRRMESMIELMNYLDRRFTLDMMLVPDNQRYYKKLVNRMKGKSNIRIRQPVTIHEIVPRLNEYDMGLFLLSPQAFNYRMALPNKFFEFIQARLGVAIWPSLEMANIVNKYKLGVVAEEFSVASAAEALNQLSSTDIKAFKHRSHQIAPMLCAESNRERLLSIVHRLMGE